jgi:hypothetical protein
MLLVFSTTSTAAEGAHRDETITNEQKFAATNDLFRAVRAQDVDGVRTALRNRADPNAGNRWGERPLHLAASLGHVRIAHILASHGADCNMRNSFGDTPLHYGSKNPDIINFLLNRCGADGTLLNKENATFWQWDDLAQRLEAKQGANNG